MTAFIDYLVNCISQESNPVKDAIQRAIARIAEIDSPKSEGSQSYGALCRIFDKVPLTLEHKHFRELQGKYLELMKLASQTIPKEKKNNYLNIKCQEFTRELVKDCSQQILNANGQLDETLTAVMQLDAVNIDAKLKLKALIYAFVHHLHSGISESIRDIIFVEAASKNKIKITDNKNPLQDIMTALRLPDENPARKAGDSAWKDIEEATGRQRIIDNEIPIILNEIQKQHENVHGYLDVYNQNIFLFLQNYIRSGHTTKWNTNFINILRDPEIIKTVKPRLSIFKLDREVIGEVLLQYIVKRFPEETRNATKKIASRGGEITYSAFERLEQIKKLVPHGATSVSIHKPQR
jgi:hypothetical protein